MFDGLEFRIKFMSIWGFEGPLCVVWLTLWCVVVAKFDRPANNVFSQTNRYQIWNPQQDQIVGCHAI